MGLLPLRGESYTLPRTPSRAQPFTAIGRASPLRGCSRDDCEATRDCHSYSLKREMRMTASTPALEEAEAPTQSTRSSNRGDTAVSIAGQMARSDFRRGDLAELRRMNADAPEPAVFWRLMAENELLGRGTVLESKWALILHGIALMTPTGSEDNTGRSAHNGHMPVGRALFLGSETTRQSRLLQRVAPQPSADSARPDFTDPVGADVSDAGRRRRLLQLAGDGAVYSQ